MLGMCAAEIDALAESESFYRQAAALARTLGDPLLLFRSLHNLASSVYLLRGQLDLALAADAEARRVVEALGHSSWLVCSVIIAVQAYRLKALSPG